MESQNNHSKWFYVFLAVITMINICQARFTELFHDEAYYWMWSKDLALGYYDHPPFIAWIISLGNSLINNELGVRFVTVFLHTMVLYLLYLLTDKEKPLLFITLLLCIPFIHIGGFFAVPDSPFIFFVALYFYFYKRFLASESILNSFLLALSVVGMLYSKYHGLMVIFFTLLSYPKLLTNKKFWGIVGMCLLMYLPFFYWSYEHQFDTLKYHLGGKTRRGYQLSFTVDYLVGEILATGGIIGGFLLMNLYKVKSQNTFESGLKWAGIGIFIFLFLLSFQQRVEVNWTAAAFIPLILLGYKSLRESPQYTPLFYKIAIPTIAIMLIARIFLMYNFVFGYAKNIRCEYHYWKNWAAEIQQVAQNEAVIFCNNYQFAAKYLFYANYKQDTLTQLSTSLNSLHYRHNQYDIANYEEKMQGKDVLLLNSYKFRENLPSFSTQNNETYYYLKVHNFHSFNKVKLTFELPKTEFKPNESVKIPITLVNAYPYPCHFSACEELPTTIGLTFWQKGVHKWEYSQTFAEALANTVLNDTLHRIITVKMPAQAGNYEMSFSLNLAEIQTGFNAFILTISMGCKKTMKKR
ncbi:MAG: ArnT family glycosyltransferase [Bacteroidia bacterium]